MFDRQEQTFFIAPSKFFANQSSKETERHSVTMKNYSTKTAFD